MSPIGRLFIILNLVLAAAFIGFAGFYLKNQTSYKTKLEEKIVAAEAEKKNLEEQIVALNGQVQNYSTDLTTKSSLLATSQTTIKSLEEADTDNKSKLQRLTQKLESIDASSAQIASKLEDQSTRIETLTKEWVAANEAKMQAVSSQNSLQDQLNAVEASLTKEKQRTESLIADLNEMTATKQDLEMQIAVIQKAIPNVADIIKGAQPAIDGTIMDVNNALQSVTISLGENSGVTPGMSFSIHDGTSYKGEVRVVEVSDNLAFARVENAVPSKSISKGDKATTRLGTR
ncbi:MAG: hypothetical protein H6832_08400 [Planctomycetes bacterium]|nr:hypothetical protein [Planctomycetota bacterium]MCB9918409.1 hypothetical protein [Planctomycetota bacterium]